MAQQDLLFMEWEPCDNFIGGKFKPVKLEHKPDRIWTLYFECDPSKRPELPIIPQHNVNAFLEDYVHDWNWQDSVFRYYTRIMDRNVWILLEYK